MKTISLLYLKYTTYVSFTFLLIQFIYQSLFLFRLLKFVFSLNLIHFYLLMYCPDNNTEHHKGNPPYSRNCQVLQKKTGNNINTKYCYSLKLDITGS